MNLTATVRSWMNNPEAFAKRIAERAETLWEDGYCVEATETPGVFAVSNPDEDKRYLVDFVQETCTCAYATKNEIPQVKCKHIQGLPLLLNEQYEQLAAFAKQHDLAGQRKRASERWYQARKLLGAWNMAQDMKAAQEVEMDVDSYRKWRNYEEACGHCAEWDTLDRDAPLPIAVCLEEDGDADNADDPDYGIPYGF